VDIQHAVEVMLLNVFLEGLFDIKPESVPGAWACLLAAAYRRACAACWLMRT
jgi:hypothetical protein